MSFFISAAYAQEAAAAQPNTMVTWIFLGGFIVVFYFMILRPQMKRGKEQRNLLSALQKGDEVVTTGGIVGRVTKVTDEFVVLSISESVQLKFQKAAVAATLPKGTIKAIDDE
ncbi:preprotein translocase subunit YajC [Gammaproteobacteria bacterium ESL0073]|uniref:Sec translocon accessory complex subunit YajC n=1 Tax=Entomomonas moraniae TaxID=2213226 RepID=A0A3Q9JLV1_9GAMM|nr:preprotein translocase subunit YajC [Entomomonas moraniae]AWM79588.1 preprotein translocase subunit YajC [Gammaproteobacteria bacterium ESL0073]AZS50789.1 preprotein translocase subunit YajC [Entomomonas moraniae]